MTAQAPEEQRMMPRARGTSRWKYAITPTILAALCGAVYLWVSGQELDSIERRILTVDNLRRAVVEHIELSVVAFVLVVAIAVPTGILLTRPFAAWATPLAAGLANLGQAIPKIGLLVVLAIVFDLGFKIAVVGIAVAAVLVVLRNTITGLEDVDPALIEAARGVGMGNLSVLLRVELPVAVPVIAAGARTGLTLIVAYGVIAVFVNAGGLGGILLTGIDLQRTTIIVTGAVLSITLALMADWLGGIAEDLLTPRGLTAR